MKSIFNHHYIFVYNNIIQFSYRPIIFLLKIFILNSEDIKESRNIFEIRIHLLKMNWNFFILTNSIQNIGHCGVRKTNRKINKESQRKEVFS